MDRVNKLVQLLFFQFRKRTRLLVAAREVNVHIGSHGEVVQGVGECSCARAVGFARVRGCSGVVDRQAAVVQQAGTGSGSGSCNHVCSKKQCYPRVPTGNRGR